MLSRGFRVVFRFIYIYTVLKLWFDYGSIVTGTIAWPGGLYGLPQPLRGCPSGWYSNGWLYQDRKPNNETSRRVSIPTHLKGEFTRMGTKRYFCMKTKSVSTLQWPLGQYCIYEFFLQENCPYGFKKGKIGWDDKDANNHNSHNGSPSWLPSGVYAANTTLNYCCRKDGAKENAITLPMQKPFYLLAYNSSTCQSVKWAVASQEYLLFTRKDYGSFSGLHPFVDENNALRYCYYQKSNKTLKHPHGIIQLQLNETSIHIVRYASWLIDVEINEIMSSPKIIMLFFTRFFFKGNPSNSYIKIFDGYNETATLLGTLSSNNRKQSVRNSFNSSRSNLFVLLCFGDKTGTYDFEFVYNTITLPSVVTTTSIASTTTTTTTTRPTTPARTTAKTTTTKAKITTTIPARTTETTAKTTSKTTTTKEKTTTTTQKPSPKTKETTTKAKPATQTLSPTTKSTTTKRKTTTTSHKVQTTTMAAPSQILPANSTIATKNSTHAYRSHSKVTVIAVSAVCSFVVFVVLVIVTWKIRKRRKSYSRLDQSAMENEDSFVENIDTHFEEIEVDAVQVSFGLDTPESELTVSEDQSESNGEDELVCRISPPPSHYESDPDPSHSQNVANEEVRQLQNETSLESSNAEKLPMKRLLEENINQSPVTDVCPLGMSCSTNPAPPSRYESDPDPSHSQDVANEEVCRLQDESSPESSNAEKVPMKRLLEANEDDPFTTFTRPRSDSTKRRDEGSNC